MTNIGSIQQVIGMIEKSPAFASNQNARQMLECIKNNDAETGQKIASNLCKSYGVSPQDAVNQARQFFHI